MRIEIKVTAMEERDYSPEHAEKTEGFYKGFASDVIKTIKEARKLDPDSLWGWCQVAVEARAYLDGGREFSGVAYLSGCSYLSREDFCTPDGYFPGMVEEAIRDLFRNLNQQSKRLRRQ